MAKGNPTIGSVWNETGSGDAPDTTGKDLYYSYQEVMSTHLAEGDMTTSRNAEASHEVYGGPTKGEANPGGMGGKG